MPTSFSTIIGQPAHRSFWYARLERAAAPQAVDDWLIEQANLRGFLGAFLARPANAPLDASLRLEEIIVGLLSPRTPVDARVFKLVLRIIQSGQVSPRKLAWWARRERATIPLRWLLNLTPAAERNHAVENASEALGAPRGYAPLRYLYDPSRLARRRATREDLWRTTRN